MSMHVSIRVSTHVLIHMPIHIHMSMHMPIHMSVRMMCISMCVNMCMCTDMLMHIMRTYRHIHLRARLCMAICAWLYMFSVHMFPPSTAIDDTDIKVLRP